MNQKKIIFAGVLAVLVAGLLAGYKSLSDLSGLWEM